MPFRFSDALQRLSRTPTRWLQRTFRCLLLVRNPKAKLLAKHRKHSTCRPMIITLDTLWGVSFFRRAASRTPSRLDRALFRSPLVKVSPRRSKWPLETRTTKMASLTRRMPRDSCWALVICSVLCPVTAIVWRTTRRRRTVCSRGLLFVLVEMRLMLSFVTYLV